MKTDAVTLEKRVEAARKEAKSAAAKTADFQAAGARLESEKTRVTELGLEMQALSETLTVKDADTERKLAEAKRLKWDADQA